VTEANRNSPFSARGREITKGGLLGQGRYLVACASYVCWRFGLMKFSKPRYRRAFLRSLVPAFVCCLCGGRLAGFAEGRFQAWFCALGYNRCQCLAGAGVWQAGQSRARALRCFQLQTFSAKSGVHGDVEISDSGEFVLTAKVRTTKKNYEHRDMCLFFGYQDPAHFYWVENDLALSSLL